MSFSESMGVVYVAVGERFVVEARRSAETVKQIHPDLPVCLISDSVPQDSCWDEFVHIDSPHRSSRDKLWMVHSPFDKSLFLDTDTIVVGPVIELFSLLDRFDLALYQPSSGYHYTLPDVPDAFPEPSSGVIGYRRSDHMKTFFESWERWYIEFKDEPGRIFDQKSLRQALYTSDLSLAVLPPEYSCIPYFPESYCHSVKILHGRPQAGLPAIASQLNQTLGYRIWQPGIGVINAPARMSLRELFLLPLLVFKSCLREAVRRIYRQVRPGNAAK